MSHSAYIDLGFQLLKPICRAVDVARTQLDLDGTPSSVFQSHNHVDLKSRLITIVPNLAIKRLGINAHVPNAKGLEQ